MPTNHEPCQSLAAHEIWSPAPGLSPRILRLRQEFWSFYERPFTNEVRAYSIGTPWDVVYAIWNWTNVPEVGLFQSGYRSYLRAAAETIELPPGFWDEPLVVRQAGFFREVGRSRHAKLAEQ